MKNLATLSFLVLLLFGVASCSDEKNGNDPEPEEDTSVFVHPGVLINETDIARMKALVSSHTAPAYDVYARMVEHSYASTEYSMKGPYSAIGRDGACADTQLGHERDFTVAWFQSLLWCLTGKQAYADKALDILYQYALTLTAIGGGNDNPLCAGFDGYTIAKSAELLKYADVPSEEVKTKLEAIDRMLEEVFVPVLDQFYARGAYANGNWGAVITRAYMAIAIHLDNKDMFDKAKDFFFNGDDNGCIKHYISDSTGQCQESGRDQRHAQLGLGALAETCELAYKQGDASLYSAYNNLLLKGFEYSAKYNSGLSVPFSTWTDVLGQDYGWTSISTNGRGDFLPYYEVVYNHYGYRKHLTDNIEFTKHVLEEEGVRPEVGLSSSDLQFTFGSLLFYQSK